MEISATVRLYNLRILILINVKEGYIIYMIIILIKQLLYILYDLINHYNLLKENYEALNLNKEEYDKYFEAEIVENLKKNEVNKGDT